MFARCIVTGIVLVCIWAECHGTPGETDLLHSLLRTYDHTTRGADNHNDTTTVNFGADLIRVNDFDHDNNIVTLALYEKWLWHDVRMEWDPNEHEGITALRVPSEILWKPDIQLYNSMSVEPSLDTDAQCVVYNSGDILWIPRSVQKVSCQLKHGHKWKCPLKFGSWTYDGNQLDLALYEGEERLGMDNYIERSDIRITSSKGYLETKYYPCCSEPYPLIRFELELKTTHGL